MRVVVTGGAGFIGGHTSKALLARGFEVLIIDNLSSGSISNVPEGAIFVEADIRDFGIANLFDDYRPDAVLHYAAQISVLESIRDPEFDTSINVNGSANVLDAAIQARTQAFVNISTGIVYGEYESVSDFPIKETSAKKLPFPYSQSKFEFERLLWGVVKKGRISAATLRPGNIYGPRQDPHGEAGVVAIFSQRLANGETIIIHGDGKAMRDYVFVDDMVDASIKALDDLLAHGSNKLESATDSVDDLAFNIGTGIGMDVVSLADTLERLAIECGIEPAGRIRGKARPGEVPRIELDATKAEKNLGWKPSTMVSDGLKKTFDWFLQESKKTDGIN